MIYMDGERMNAKDLAPKKEILEGIFPTFFRKENPLPIHLDWIRTAKQAVEIYKPGGEVKAGIRYRTPQAISINPVGFEYQDDIRIQVRYTERSPIVQSGELHFPTFKMAIGKMVLQPGKDFEKLVFLWFYCNQITNNATTVKGTNPRIEFIIPEKVVGTKYDNITLRRKYEDEILIEGTRMSFDALKSLASELNINGLRGEEKHDRVIVFDALLSSDVLREKYASVKGNMTSHNKKGSGNANDVVNASEIKSKVDVLISEDKLFTNDGFWRLKGKGPHPKKLIASVEDEDENIFNIVQYFVENHELV